MRGPIENYKMDNLYLTIIYQNWRFWYKLSLSLPLLSVSLPLCFLSLFSLYLPPRLYLSLSLSLSLSPSPSLSVSSHFFLISPASFSLLSLSHSISLSLPSPLQYTDFFPFPSLSSPYIHYNPCSKAGILILPPTCSRRTLHTKIDSYHNIPIQTQIKC